MIGEGLPDWIRERLEMPRGYALVSDTENLFSVLWRIVDKVCENIPGER